MSPSFLNVDLDIKSASPLHLLETAMGKRVVVLDSGPGAKAKQHLLILESSRLHKSPDATIHALCTVVEGLSPDARRVWDRAQKEFDVGYELRSSERYSRFTLRTDTLHRVASLGATLAVTCYRGETAD